uniref:CCHC-type domain-containing protein n=1 Tax=Rhabditophanes sp. KR3021 TaxID=114890 RepID=A0AC35UIG2_9BILA
MSDRECYKCHEVGHFARECTASGGGDDSENYNSKRACFGCGSTEHLKINCPSGGGDSYERRGGYRRDGGRDRRDGGDSYGSRRGGDRDGGEVRRCFNCNSTDGHFSRDCPEERKTVCYRCNGEGHKSFECESSGGNDSYSKSRGDRSDDSSRFANRKRTFSKATDSDERKCFSCSQTGHRAAQCPDAKPKGCFTCGGDHLKRDCRQEE